MLTATQSFDADGNLISEEVVEIESGSPPFERVRYEAEADKVLAELDDFDTRFATLTAAEKDAALQLLLKAVKVLALDALGRLDS